MATAVPEPGTTEATWQAQFGLMQRWLIRLRAADAGDLSYMDQKWCGPDIGLLLYKDDAIAFFQACYHLKDWLKRDPASRDKASDVEDYVANTTCLQLAADVSNRSKHGLADRHTRVDENAQLRAHRLVVHGADGQFEMSGSEKILVKGEFMPAIEVAEDCFESWTVYLKEHGLT